MCRPAGKVHRPCTGPPSWSAARSLGQSLGSELALLQVTGAQLAYLASALLPIPNNPMQTPKWSGANSGRQSEGAGWARSDLVTASQVFKRPRHFRGFCHLQMCVCACVCVYLPSNLSIYIYVCRNVGPRRQRPRGGGHSLGPLFSAPGLGLSSTHWGMTPHRFHHRQAGPGLAPQQRPMYLRLFCMMTSVTASKTNWMLLVSVAQVKWE